MICQKASNHNYWDFRGKEVWIIGGALYHYLCQCIIPHDNKVEQVSDTVVLRQSSITIPAVTPEGRIIHGINTLMGAIIDAPAAKSDTQIQAITAVPNVYAILESSNETPAPAAPITLPYPVQPHCFPRLQNRMVNHPKP